MMPKFIIYTDGGARGNPGPAGAGAVITDEAGREIKQVYQELGVMTKNEAEYEAVLRGLNPLKKIKGGPSKPASYSASLFEAEYEAVLLGLNTLKKIKGGPTEQD